MKIIKIILIVIGFVILLPFISVLWIVIIGGAFLSKLLEEPDWTDWIALLGGLAIVCVLQLLWLFYIVIPVVNMLRL